MNRIRTRWLRWRYPEAYAVADRVRRDADRRAVESAVRRDDTRPAAERFCDAMDAVTEQARAQQARPVAPEQIADAFDVPREYVPQYRSTADAAQAFLEGDARQQDDAARWLGTQPLPDVVTWDTLRAAAAGHPEPRFCHHPNAVTELRQGLPTRWVRARRGSRWTLRRVPAGSGTYVHRCPDCRMWAGQVEIPGLVSDLRLPPCLLPTTPATPADGNGS